MCELNFYFYVHCCYSNRQVAATTSPSSSSRTTISNSQIIPSSRGTDSSSRGCWTLFLHKNESFSKRNCWKVAFAFFCLRYQGNDGSYDSSSGTSDSSWQNGASSTSNNNNQYSSSASSSSSFGASSSSSGGWQGQGDASQQQGAYVNLQSQGGEKGTWAGKTVGGNGAQKLTITLAVA